ncbi:hypothetical protein RLIN73S_04135 [Rhodanobacter lindaniclasticus]
MHAASVRQADRPSTAHAGNPRRPGSGRATRWPRRTGPRRCRAECPRHRPTRPRAPPDRSRPARDPRSSARNGSRKACRWGHGAGRPRRSRPRSPATSRTRWYWRRRPWLRRSSLAAAGTDGRVPTARPACCRATCPAHAGWRSERATLVAAGDSRRGHTACHRNACRRARTAARSPPRWRSRTAPARPRPRRHWAPAPPRRRRSRRGPARPPAAPRRHRWKCRWR